MKAHQERIAFGPVPSRRLGHSLGINNIPPKSCSYSCVYCQVGPTHQPEIRRRRFQGVDRVVDEVTAAVQRLREQGRPIDYLTFVPDGEPTLDADLGAMIDRLSSLCIPIAVISNGSLAWRADVRRDLARADVVSFKVDAVDEDAWRSINRPNPDLRIESVLQGMLAFARDYRGVLLTETMLVAGLDDEHALLSRTADYVARLAPRTAYLAVPTRPPAEPSIRGPSDAALAAAYDIFTARGLSVELLTGYVEHVSFPPSATPREALLSITAVHPMRRSEVEQLLADSGGAGWDTVERLVDAGELRAVDHAGHTFYVRRPPHD